ncbi:mycothiol S-conjugate amidase [Serinibacter salmoneus]|uniref:Mycothiol S-conjugate amidase n=2 Tax=Serinibacter salmoneus TaxID=556530 RepID=A0A2A9D3L2_9MICO|nr:mycothiol S-conjugate amidase [Serinibacter salmoneus]
MTAPRLMAVHAHPDDESSKGAGTMARYAAQGAEVLVVTCTGGERGDVLNPRLQHDPRAQEDLPALRREEMAAAKAALGVEQVWLGFVDSGLPEGDPLPPLPPGCFALAPLEETSRALVAHLRSFRPHVVLTYDENGGYPHPDHIMTHVVTMAAIEAAADPAAFPELGEPWEVPKVYYHVSFSRDRLLALHEAMGAEGIESPFGDWVARWDGRGSRTVTARIDVHEFFPQRDAALLAHATQIDPDGFFFAVPREIEARVWPWEEFELVRTTLAGQATAAAGAPAVEDLEDDLFAGVTL